ncbi:MAG TPA: DUF4157 domain-containing protein [Steroidobacteraceae bacterium]|nr:DUF4157 domain-containing protein [Steroidobacteraceae bacterium]
MARELQQPAAQAPQPASDVRAPSHEEALERQADAIARSHANAPASEQGVRDRVGRTLGVDFSGVKIHRDSARASGLGAHAFAENADIHLAPGRFRPDLSLGRALLAHEFTHVAQQRAVPRSVPKSGAFRDEMRSRGSAESSKALEESADTISEPDSELAVAPRGMQQRCIAGCKSCSHEEDEAGTAENGKDSGTGDAGVQNAGATPQPTHAVGPSATAAGKKVVRLAWTIDDGPTPHTGAMASAMAPRASTWFIMNNQLGSGKTRSTALTDLVKRQSTGDEIGIHSMHPTVAHSAWFPISLGSAVPKGYTKTSDAMTDLKAFTKELRAAGLGVHFARMPGGELSEVKKYVEDAGGSSSTSEATASALLSGTTPTAPAPAAVATDVALVMSTIRSLNLHLWSGSATGPEVTRNTWEAESSGVTARTDDVVKRFKGVVDKLASGSRKTPGSFVILAHDTTAADVTQAGSNIAAMETYATSKGVRVEYYSMASLYTLLRGTAP